MRGGQHSNSFRKFGLPQDFTRCSLCLYFCNLNSYAHLFLFYIWINLSVAFLFQFEQVSDLGPRALAISLPFSCVLGLLSSIIASTMGELIFAFIYQVSFMFLHIHFLNSLKHFSFPIIRKYYSSSFCCQFEICSPDSVRFVTLNFYIVSLLGQGTILEKKL